MDIQVGDKVTGKWLDNNQEITEVVISNERLEIIKHNIKNNQIQILKIERQKYEVIEEHKELLTEEEKEFLKQALKFGNYKNNDIKYIIQMGNFIYFHFNDWATNTIPIDENVYFKRLVEGEKYTLEELGIN